MNCRHCQTPLRHVFLDLGYAPPSKAYLSADDLKRPEISYPLKLFVCDHCWLVQTQDFVAADELFRDDYAYFSSTSSSWLKHAADYGAAAKGNTLLNYASVKPDLLPYVCDAAAAKQGKYLPGSHIPIRPPAALRDDPPDELLILPWNIADEVRAQLADLAERGTRFVTAVPTLHSC